MIGNDLIFLPGWPGHKGRRKERFREKIFHPAEFMFLEEQYRWSEPLLWSMKEAAYKVVYRNQPEWRFAPKSLRTKIIGRHDNFITGSVSYENLSFLTRSVFTGDYLHTIALTTESFTALEECGVSLQENSKDRPRMLYDAEGKPVTEIVKDSNGIPHFSINSGLADYPVSVSHDHQLMAICWYPSI